MSKRFKLYNVNIKYIRNLHNVDDNVPFVSPRIGDVHDRWIINEEAADVVRCIYQLIIAGNGPMPELTPEQIKEEDHKRRKRAWNRTYMRRKYEREKAECETKEKELSEVVG